MGRDSLQPYLFSSQEVEVYVKSTQTDIVSMEPQKNDDEDEDELVVEVVSTKSAVAVASEPDKVSVFFLDL